MGLPKGRGADAASALSQYVEEMKASGFVTEVLARHGILDAAMALWRKCLVLSHPPHMATAQCARFWSGITRGTEKCVKLSLGIFYSCHLPRHTPFTPKHGHIALSPHRASGSGSPFLG